MNSSRGKPKGNPTFVAALKTLKRLQEKQSMQGILLDMMEESQNV
jgi:hypothetical protein